MANKARTIDVILNLKNRKNTLTFVFSKEINLNLEDDDINKQKEVFLKIADELVKGPIKLNFKVSDDYPSKVNLFADASKTYIEKLNEEIDLLEKDEDLKEIRKLLSE